MDRETMVLYIIAGISLVFALVNSFLCILKRNVTEQTTATIMSIKLPNSETAKARNSKWAEVTYKVNGRNYTSQNRIQVPMSAEIGSKIKVRYDIRQPEKLYSYSPMRIIISLLIAAFCLAIATFDFI